jgi:predicted metal-dependent enzyme (double-stranded beta helix superfamily)
MKVLYKPLSLMASVLGGMLAGALFRAIWKFAAHEEDAPKATDARRGWGEILSAAALQGAVYGVVKAAIDRATAEGTHRLTGFWPGENGDRKKTA